MPQTLNPNHPGTVTLDAETGQELRQLLTGIHTHSQAQYVALLDQSGFLICQVGESHGDPTIVAALSAAAFSATQGLADHLGEMGFGGMYHPGGEKSLYMVPITQRFMILALFGKATSISKVREGIRRAIAPMGQLLSRV
ncbi:MAG: roadblock/LC7 domain-containing protein [Verrucomicrobiota bacterium]